MESSGGAATVMSIGLFPKKNIEIACVSEVGGGSVV